MRDIKTHMLAAGAALVLLAGCQSVGGAGPETSGAQSAEADFDTTERTLWAAGRDAEGGRKYDIAANAFGRLYELRTNDPQVLTSFIRNMRYSGRAKEITSYVEANTKHLMGDFGVKFEYAKALLAANRKADALRALEEVAALSPGDWQVQSARGIVLDALGRFDEAISAYGAALALSPDNVVVMNNMAMSLAMSGQLQNAIETLERAAALNRTDPQVRQNLALLYAVSGDAEKARTLAAMDLESSEVETNLSFYRRFGGGLP